MPVVAQAAIPQGSSVRTVTYDAGLEGSTLRPIAGSVLTGKMQLHIYPDGIVQGTYFPLDGNAFAVSGGVQQNGNVNLVLGRITVSGHVNANGSIVGSSFGPAAFDDLTFIAHPVQIERHQIRR